MNTTMKKNIGILVALVAVVVSVMLIGRSLAYFTSERNHDSQYEVSVIDTHVDEEFEPDPDDENMYIKNPRIVNQGESDAIVRVRYEISNSSQKDNVEMIDIDGKSNWKKESDGYYYYQGILPVGESTDTLFDKVKIKDVDKMEDFDIIVYSEAIQTVAYKDDGTELSAKDENGHYVHDKALELWKYYK